MPTLQEIVTPLAAFLETDTKGKYATIQDVSGKTVQLALSSGVGLGVPRTAFEGVSAGLKKGGKVYFNTECWAWEIVAPVASQPATETSSLGQGSTTLRQQAF